MQMMTSMLNPSQKQSVNLFQNKNNEEQAEMIANKCNELGIGKEQLQSIIGLLQR